MANNSSSTSFVVGSTSPAHCFLSQPGYDPYNTTNLPDSVNTIRTVLSVVNGVASPLTVIINALISWSVLGDEDLRSSSFNILLVALAVSDFLVGLLAQPVFSYYQSCLVNNCYSPCTSTLYVLSGLIFGGLSVSTLTFVCLERYLAIEHPNFYRKMVTAKRVMLGTMIYWAVNLAILMSAIVIDISNKSKQLSLPQPLVFLGLSTLVILYCSIKVQVTAYRQRRTITLQQESVQQPDEQQQQQERFKEYKRVFMMTILVIMSILFYVPFIIVIVIQAVAGTDITSDFNFVAMPICLTLFHVQSPINPILVSLRLSYIRTSIKNKLASLFGGN